MFWWVLYPGTSVTQLRETDWAWHWHRDTLRHSVSRTWCWRELMMNIMWLSVELNTDNWTMITRHTFIGVEISVIIIIIIVIVIQYNYCCLYDIDRSIFMHIKSILDFAPGKTMKKQSIKWRSNVWCKSVESWETEFLVWTSEHFCDKNISLLTPRNVYSWPATKNTLNLIWKTRCV